MALIRTILFFKLFSASVFPVNCNILDGIQRSSSGSGFSPSFIPIIVIFPPYMHVKKAPERSASTKFSPSAISKFPVTCFQFPHKTGIHLYLTFPFQNHFARLPVDSITHAILIANEHPHCLIRISRQCFFSNKIFTESSTA